ncbi:peptide deformylase [candidate division KSB1 bacterium]|nr:peptide deformylase [candidate division KSB1 bacterium]
MALLPIIHYGNPILRMQAAEIEQIDDDVKQLANDMIETMVTSDGIGLAAPQVAESIALIVVDLSLIFENQMPMAFINPKILETDGAEVSAEEGCLSVPDIREEVFRPDKVRISYKTIDGESVEAWAEGLLARVLQHEIDHLRGVFFVDRIKTLRKKLISKQLKNIAKEEKARQKTPA